MLELTGFLFREEENWFEGWLVVDGGADRAQGLEVAEVGLGRWEGTFCLLRLSRMWLEQTRFHILVVKLMIILSEEGVNRM